MKWLFGLTMIAILSACNQRTSATKQIDELALDQTIAERYNAYTYVPLDALKVFAAQDKGCESRQITGDVYLNALPDNTVRISVRQISGKLNGSAGPVSLGSEGNQYEVVLDYINADTANVPFYIGQYDPKTPLDKAILQPLGRKIEPGMRLWVERVYPEKENQPTANVVIPVYVGVGLRLTAKILVLKGTVNLSSLGAIAASAEAGKSTGSLVVQTLGINGKQVATSLTLPNDLNPSTVQSAIQGLGAIKAIMYDSAGTRITPRAVGMYFPLANADSEVVNSIVSELARTSINWYMPCFASGSATGKAEQTIAPASAAAARANSPDVQRTPIGSVPN